MCAGLQRDRLRPLNSLFGGRSLKLQAELDRALGALGKSTSKNGWLTPTAADGRRAKLGSHTVSYRPDAQNLPDQLSRVLDCDTEPRWLNPPFVRWLMGFPAAWCDTAPGARGGSRTLTS